MKATALIQALLNAKLTYVAIAQQLNQVGFKTTRESTFQATQVMRLAQRAKIDI